LAQRGDHGETSSLGHYYHLGITDDKLQAVILQQAAENTLAYSQLVTHRAHIAPLSMEYTNAMWSLVDYSTISNTTSASPAANQSPGTNFWFESWVDLFGMQDNVGDFNADGFVVHDNSLSQVESMGTL
jgi:hypothetical protein